MHLNKAPGLGALERLLQVSVFKAMKRSENSNLTKGWLTLYLNYNLFYLIFYLMKSNKNTLY